MIYAVNDYLYVLDNEAIYKLVEEGVDDLIIKIRMPGVVKFVQIH